MIKITLTALTCVSGILSALYWWQSSRVEPDPVFVTLQGGEQIRASSDGDYSQTIDALREMGRLNKYAAAWSAVTPILVTLSGIAGYFG